LRSRIPVKIGTPVLAEWPPKPASRKKLAEPDLLFCQHGRLLSPEETGSFRAEQARISRWSQVGAERDGELVPLSGECPRCFSTCSHDFITLSPEEIASGKRWSGKCPGCEPELATSAAWASFLKFWGYSDGRGMSPTTFTAKLPSGRTLIAGFGGNFATGRGSAALEEIDSRHQYDQAKSLARTERPRLRDL
jgi:hypothetical protein